MRHTILEREFFARPALQVAKELLGKHLVRQVDGERIAVMIDETEAYVGPHDLACHASRGLTPRTAVMFGPPGFWYVYFCYGMHWMLNIVTERNGYPAAVLLRGAGEWNGPARLTKALRIDKQLNATRAEPAAGLWIEDWGIVTLPRRIERTPRIGVDYAGQWAAKPYRFLLKPGAQRKSGTRRSRVRSSQA